MVGRRPSDTCGNGTPSNRQGASSIRSAPRRIGSRQLDLNYHSSLNSLRAPPLPERERVGERVFFLQEPLTRRASRVDLSPQPGRGEEGDQNASAGNSITVSAPVVMRLRCAALSGSTRSMKNLPVTSFAFMRSSEPFAPFLSFSCATLAICAHM